MRFLSKAESVLTQIGGAQAVEKILPKWGKTPE